MATVEVLDSFMSYRDAATAGGGGGIPVVFLHGNPTSSYLWRNVIPPVADQARCLAPDLIGMGESGKPDIAYRFADYVRYLDAWFDALGLDEVIIVGHDWGGALGMDWAARHPGRARGIAVVETFLRPLYWEEMPPQAAELFRGYRSPTGEEMVIKNNMLIEVSLPRGTAGGLAKSDHDVYRAPFLEPASRKPMLAWAREFPLDGEPADVVEVVLGYDRWMAATPDVPKLLMAVENGVGLGSPQMIAWAAEHFASAEVEPVGPGGHQVPEDQPEAIGLAVASWLQRHALAQDGVSTEAAEAEVVARAVDGDKAALEEVIRLLQDPLYRLALRMVRRPAEAEDATQEILIRVVTRLATWRGEAKLLTWAYRIGVNYLLNLRRQSPQEARQLSLDEFRDDLADGLADEDYRGPEAMLLAEEVRLSCTQSMLQCLERGERIAFVLSDIFELSSPDAAWILDISPAAYRKRLERARQRIRAFMESTCGLVNPAAFCRCARRVQKAVAAHRVDPRNPVLVAHPVSPSGRGVAEAAAQLHRLHDAAAVLRAHPDYAAPQARVDAIAALLKSGRFPLLK